MLFYMASKPFNPQKNNYISMYYLFFNRYPQMLFFALTTFYVVILPFKKKVCKSKLRTLCYYVLVGVFCCAVYQHWDLIAGVIYALDVCECLCVAVIAIIIKFARPVVLLKDNNLVKIVLVLFISAKRRWEGERWEENLSERLVQVCCLLSLQTSKSFLKKLLQQVVPKDDAKTDQCLLYLQFFTTHDPQYDYDLFKLVNQLTFGSLEQFVRLFKHGPKKAVRRDKPKHVSDVQITKRDVIKQGRDRLKSSMSSKQVIQV